jgi:hypothetical protein
MAKSKNYFFRVYLRNNAFCAQFRLPNYNDDETSNKGTIYLGTNPKEAADRIYREIIKPRGRFNSIEISGKFDLRKNLGESCADSRDLVDIVGMLHDAMPSLKIVSPSPQK